MIVGKGSRSKKKEEGSRFEPLRSQKKKDCNWLQNYEFTERKIRNAVRVGTLKKRSSGRASGESGITWTYVE